MGYKPPNSIQRMAAIGPITGLEDAFQRALEPQDDFQPVPEAGPSDWLANHPEAGQTFEQFVRSQPNRPDQRLNKLFLQPIGGFTESDGPSLDQLRQFTAMFFMMDVEVLPPLGLIETDIASRRNPWTGRLQLLTSDILALLKSRLPVDGFALLGMTMTDLYPDPKWNFVFGEASLRDRVGVYSFARYDPRFYGQAPSAISANLLLRRSCKVLAHETGHVFGIEHCIWYRCLMNGSNHLSEADTRPLHVCPVDLRKLQWSVGFDVVRRYRDLLDFDQRAGFEDEVHWLEKRIRFILQYKRNNRQQ